MTESILEVRDRLFGKPEVALTPAPPSIDVMPTLVLEDPDSGRVTISTPLEVAAQAADEGTWYRRLTARLVEAERANANGAFWTEGDLEFGLPTVANGPLNVGHEADAVVGVLTKASLADGDGFAYGRHIATDATMWRWVRPELTDRVEAALESGKAYVSMECVSNQIECAGDSGCGAIMEYADMVTRSGGACSHVRERSSHRRFVNPMFLGAGIILAPDRPAWAQAELTEAARAAEGMVEAAGIPGLEEDEAHKILSAMVAYSRRPRA